MKIEPGLSEGSTYVTPVQDYYVVFWRQPRVLSSADVNQESVMWAGCEQYVRNAADVHEVISWAEKEGHRRSATYTLYAVTSNSGCEVLIWLAGVDPTNTGQNFERRHPVDVDPVSGTPGEVYGPSNTSQSA